MHRPFRSRVEHKRSKEPCMSSEVCCASKVAFPGAVALFSLNLRSGKIQEIDPPKLSYVDSSGSSDGVLEEQFDEDGNPI
ncbi:unnamed protein product [Amoebophrya sp. A25]|nr:unnamed protein product [Amoebophrya sp. A25]|eukprot:GSA25T00010237001.1